MSKEAKNIKVAVIGFGHLGKWHAEKAYILANLVAIVEKHPENRSRAKKLYPEVTVVESIDEVIDVIDAAVIVTPTSTHFDFVKKLIDHNIHVFCEKPLCSNDDEADKIKKLMNSKNNIIQVGHSERFHESWEIIDKYQKYLSDECVIRMNRFSPYKGRASDVDVVQDLMIHDMDLLVYLLKEMPVSVQSTGYKIRTSNWDYVCSQFNFKSGRKAFIVASRNHVKEARDMEVFSKEGCLYVDLFKNEIHIASQERAVNGEYIETMEYSKRDHLLLEQSHFYESINSNKKAIVSLDDGLVAVHLISQVLESLESGKLTEIKQ